MRKTYKRKRSCAVCHPSKTGDEPRWKAKDLMMLRQWDNERREWLHGAGEHEIHPYPPKTYEEWPEPPDDVGRWVFEDVYPLEPDWW